VAATYLIDTNICIYITKHHPLSVMHRFERLQPGDVVMSFITYGELLFGAEKSSYRESTVKKLQRLVELIPIELPGPEISTHYGKIRAHLEKRGRPIGANDLWIAAHARSREMTLVSNNLKEFERVPGLRMENWA